MCVFSELDVLESAPDDKPGSIVSPHTVACSPRRRDVLADSESSRVATEHTVDSSLGVVVYRVEGSQLVSRVPGELDSRNA